LALDGMLTVGEQFTLTAKGREAALKLIRAHRIYEQYLAEHSGYAPTEWHQRAHRMEHHISKDEQERYISLLGNPLYDPHGDPIPTDSLAMAPARHTAQSPLPNTYWRIAHVEDDDADIFQRILQTGLAKDAVIHVLSINGKRFSFRYEGETFQLPTKTLGALDLIPLTADEAHAEWPVETFRLHHLGSHEKARIVGLSPACRGALRRRLLDLGFVRGSRVSVAMHSPMGNPTAYVVRGTTIALRQDQARYILAVPASSEGTQKDEQSSKSKV
jgi:iron dependent repressor